MAVGTYVPIFTMLEETVPLVEIPRILADLSPWVLAMGRLLLF